MAVEALGGGAKIATVLKFPRILKLRGQKVATVLKKQKKQDLKENGRGGGGQLCSTASPPYARFSWFLEGGRGARGKAGSHQFKAELSAPCFPLASLLSPWLLCVAPLLGSLLGS